MFIRVGSFAVGLMWLATVFAGGATASPPIRATTQFAILHYFAAGYDGANPVAGVVADPWGNLYGVTEYGGVQNSGVVFTLPPDTSQDSILYTFTGQSGGTDGALPVGGLALGNCNNNTKTCMLYGTTSQGGDSGNCTNGCGTVFAIATDGSGYTQLHSFSGSDGSNPIAGLALDSSGNLYGTTLYGGRTACGAGCGTVFELAGGNLTTLYSFCAKTNCTDGQYPSAPVLIANGNLYGTTELGGANNRGTVFSIQDEQEAVLYSFCNIVVCADGAQPEGGLLIDSNSDLYGTTYTGGNAANCSGGGCGTVFKLSANGTEAIIQQFGRNQNPEAGMTSDSSGNLYGVIPGGSGGLGAKRCAKGCQEGDSFEITTSGTYSVQHAFNGEGAQPINPPLILNGNFYGTTEFGGYPCQNGTTCGTVYEIIP